jgi:hypothetical protein
MAHLLSSEKHSNGMLPSKRATNNFSNKNQDIKNQISWSLGTRLFKKIFKYIKK